MNELLPQLALASGGLACAAVLAAGLLRLWKRRPDLSYGVLRTLLVLTLMSLPLQLLLTRVAPTVAFRPALPRVSWFHDEAARPALHSDSGEPARATERAAASETSELDALEGAQSWLPFVPELPRLEPETTAASPPRTSIDSRVPVSWAPWLGRVYALGLSFVLLRLFGRLRASHRLLASARAVEDPETLRLWESLTLPTDRGYRLRLSEQIRVPACVGLLRPTVLLPVQATELHDSTWIASVLRHELVHLERRDCWSLVGQELLVALFWFHPAAYWLRHRLDDWRELSCDWVVVQRTGRTKQYASALLECAAKVDVGRPLPAGLAPWAHSQDLLQRRIDMLVTGTRGEKRPRRIAATLAATSFLTLWGGQLAYAWALAPQAPAPEPSEGNGLGAKLVDSWRALLAEGQGAEAPQPDPDELGLELSGGAKVVVAPASPIEPLEPLEPLAHVAPPEPMEPLARFEPAEPFALAASPAPLPGIYGQSDNELFFPRTDSSLRLGVYLERPDGALAAQLSVPAAEAWVLNGVAEGSLAEASGLRRYDVIIGIDGGTAGGSSLDEAKARLSDGQDVRVEVRRAGQTVHLTISAEQARELGQRSAFPNVAPEKPKLPYRFEGFTRKTPRPDQDWPERARKYYREVQPEGFRSDLKSALENYKELARKGGLGARDKAHADYLRSILEGNVQKYLDQSRKYLEATPEVELKKQLEEALRYKERLPWAQDTPAPSQPDFWKKSRPERDEISELRTQLEDLRRELELLRSARKGGR